MDDTDYRIKRFVDDTGELVIPPPDKPGQGKVLDHADYWNDRPAGADREPTAPSGPDPYWGTPVQRADQEEEQPPGYPFWGAPRPAPPLPPRLSRPTRPPMSPTSPMPSPRSSPVSAQPVSPQPVPPTPPPPARTGRAAASRLAPPAPPPQGPGRTPPTQTPSRMPAAQAPGRMPPARTEPAAPGRIPPARPGQSYPGRLPPVQPDEPPPTGRTAPMWPAEPPPIGPVAPTTYRSAAAEAPTGYRSTAADAPTTYRSAEAQAPPTPVSESYRRGDTGWRQPVVPDPAPADPADWRSDSRWNAGGGAGLNEPRSSWDDEDDEEDDEPRRPASYVYSALAALGWFVLPVLAYLGYAFMLNDEPPSGCTVAGGTDCLTPRAEALHNLFGNVPLITTTVSVSILIALVLRRFASGWRTITVGFAAAVVGAGAATVLFTVVSN